MKDRDAAGVARLHAETITEGFLVRLGARLLRELYLGIANDEESHVWVAEDGAALVGFCSYSRDVSAMYRRVLRNRFLRLACASLPHALSPAVVKEVFDTLRYPAKQAARNLPPAEILSIGVGASARGKGAGRQLLNKALQQAHLDGEAEVKVVAGAKLDSANRFYRACGFEQRAEIIQHGETLRVYVKRVEP